VEGNEEATRNLWRHVVGSVRRTLWVNADTSKNLGEVLLGLLLVIVGGLVAVGLYFIPTIQAHQNKKRQTQAIFCLNLLLGWTVLGWVVAMVWAVTKD
jgi:hypothetical protein